MTYSCDRIIRYFTHASDPDRTLEFLDTPEMFAGRYHVRKVELQHTRFASAESAYLREFRAE